MELISDYMTCPERRYMLNELTRRTFGFDFEEWVTNGYFEGEYIPFSFTDGEKLLSNASVNIMTFDRSGVRRNYIQIGTVMTDEEYRCQGLAGKLIRHIVQKYSPGCDGIYLFGNLSALDFYRNLGFSEGIQYRWKLRSEVEFGRAESMFVPAGEKLRRKYLDAVRGCAVNSSLEQINRFGLQMFYTGDLSNVYYAQDIDCFAVMELSGDVLQLNSVVCSRRIPLSEVISRIGMEYSELILGFAPLSDDAVHFECEPYDGGDDYRLFYLGEQIGSLEQDRLFFPQLSHA